jgi:hypothetical protein
MTKISQLSSIGDSLAIDDQFLIRDVSDGTTPNKSVTVSGITRALADGSETAPALAFASDKDTGIYRSGANALAISTNGTQRILIEDDGDINIDSGGVFYDATNNRLAIGTTAPNDYNSEANDLVVAATGQTGITIASTDSSNSNIYFADGTAGSAAYRGVLRYEHSTDSMQFWAAAGEAFRVDSSKRLLVGTSSGTSNGKLVVNGGAVFTNVNTQTISTASYVDLEVMRFLVNKGSYIEESFSGDVTVHVKAQRGASVNNMSCQALKCFVTLGSFSNFNDIRMLGEVKSIDSTVLRAGTAPGTLTVALVLESSVDGGSTWTALAATTSTDTTNATALIRLRANLTGTPPSSMSTITTTTSVSGLVVGNISVNSTTITTA